MTAYELLPDLPAVYDVESARALLRAGGFPVSRSTLWSAIRRSEVATVRLGRLVKIPRSEIARLLGLVGENGAAKEVPP